MDLRTYFIDGNVVSEQSFKDTLETMIDENVKDNIDDLLDDCYPEYTIGYLSFTASEIVKNCDPVAYKEIICEEKSARLDDAMYELEQTGSFIIGGLEFTIEEFEPKID